MPPHLPPEIVDAIIGSITDDTLQNMNQTLLNCALVCQAWLPASRSRLLTSIDLASSSAYNTFVESVLRSSRLNPYLASTEFVWLTDPSKRDGPQPPEEEEQGWSHRFIHDFAGHLPNIESLMFENADWIHRPLHPSSHLALSRFSSLKELLLYDCKFPSASTVRRVVSALTSLDNLQLHNVTWPFAYGAVSPTYISHAHGPALKTLYLMYYRGDDDCLAPLLLWLSRTPTRHSLRDLTFKSTRTGVSPNANEYMAFLKEVAPRVEELEISLTSLGDIPIHLFKSLGVLSLSVDRRSKEHWHAVSRLLLTLPSEYRIHHLEFTMWLKTKQVPGAGLLDEVLRPAAIEDDGLELLEAVLHTEPFHNIDGVEFAVLGNTSYSQSEAVEAEACILDIIRQKIPKIVDRGFVSVDWNGLRTHHP